jgi:hypothetical protein
MNSVKIVLKEGKMRRNSVGVEFDQSTLYALRELSQ